jgi:hypothetical protein
MLLISIVSNQGYTNPRGQVVRKKKFSAVASNVYGSSVWKLRHVTLMEPRIFEAAFTFFFGKYVHLCIKLWKREMDDKFEAEEGYLNFSNNSDICMLIRKPSR